MITTIIQYSFLKMKYQYRLKMWYDTLSHCVHYETTMKEIHIWLQDRTSSLQRDCSSAFKVCSVCC